MRFDVRPFHLLGKFLSDKTLDLAIGMYRVLESIKDDAAQEYQPALTGRGLTSQSRNLGLN